MEERILVAFVGVVVAVLPILWLAARGVAHERRVNRMGRRLRDDIGHLTPEERSKVIDAYLDAVSQWLR